MSNIDRSLSGKALYFRLAQSRSELLDASLLDRSGRTARTLVKEGSLRVTLIAVGPGGNIEEHRADGPITILPVSGRVRFRAGEDEWVLEEGDLLSLGAGVPHSVSSEDGCVFLLTLASKGAL